MQDQQRRDNAIIRLAAQGYDVHPDPPGYRICHSSNLDDVSLARHLDDLEEIADLMEWAAGRPVRQENQRQKRPQNRQ